VDMFGANAYANWDDFLSYEGKPERTRVDKDGYGLGPLHRLYRCADGWVFLMIATDDEWTVLRDELHLEVDRNAADLENVLGDVFGAGQADDFEARLAPKGIGCVRADGLQPPAFLLEDEHCGVEELRVPAVHPDWGDYFRNGPMVRFSKGDDYPGTGAMGGATVALLEELGYSSTEIDALIADRTVGVRAPA
ncbi:MAG: CoA transferase, partial [Gammaproteobacteria bacterium]|nr:CoA transferase [Gammaproteobacteria bacterium]